ncbi:proteasome complex subunit Rpn13 ubiquitin receptor-domain-containing protein [Hyaloscypha finlandica]|nr:proteasome complex subunit Rpn13 ubiquitin receptor-domain-containing protein [Hyaloscypha finlandica]
MSANPIITFKAGRCDIDQSNRPWKITPDPTPGYIYMYSEDDMTHFCWRERSKAMTDEDNLDLIMFPSDAHFEPYEYKTSNQPTSKTNGRIFVLKFSSSSSRYFFWMQSKPQARNGDTSWFSPRDLKIGQIVDMLLQGEEVNVSEEIAQARGGGNGGNEDEDQTMEDVEGHGDPSEHHRGGSGGAGPDATGGDIREEGAGAREGGADGGRAAGSGPTDAATVVQNFLNSLKGGQGIPTQPQGGQMFTTLPDLLPSSTTIPIIDSASPAQIDNLLSYLPPAILLISRSSSAQIDRTKEPSAASASAAIEALPSAEKKAILKRVLRSPQFHQSLGSLTMAIRDGGLPSISDALGVKVQNGGFVRGGGVPLGGGEAVEAFVEGVKKSIEEKK